MVKIRYLLIILFFIFIISPSYKCYDINSATYNSSSLSICVSTQSSESESESESETISESVSEFSLICNNEINLQSIIIVFSIIFSMICCIYNKYNLSD